MKTKTMMDSELIARLDILSDPDYNVWDWVDIPILRIKNFTLEQADLAYEALVRAPDSCDTLAQSVVWILIRAKASWARVNAAFECGFARHDLRLSQLDFAAGWIYRNGLSEPVLALVAPQFKWHNRILGAFFHIDLTLALTFAFSRRRRRANSKVRT